MHMKKILFCFWCHQPCTLKTGYMSVRPAFLGDDDSDQRKQIHMHSKCFHKYYASYREMQEQPQVQLPNGMKVIL